MGRKPEMPALTYSSVFDRIQGTYLLAKCPYKLKPKEEEIRQRWETAFNMLVGHRTTAATVRMLMRLNPGLSRAQAHRDVSNAQRLFGTVHKTSKDAARHIAAEWTTQVFRHSFSKGDMDSANKAIANYIKLHGLDKDDPDLPDFSKIQAPNVVINLQQNMTAVLQQMISTGSFVLDDAIPAEQIPYVEPKPEDYEE